VSDATIPETPPRARLIARAAAWRDQDPDDTTRDALAALIDRAEAGDERALTDLNARFDGRLQFGTAGLRGELGAGPTRMNRVLVAQAAAGLAAYLVENRAHPSIVIGYDGRENSDVFARDTAEIMAGAGVRATILPDALPTPVLAFAVRHLDASAGVMVTASHNPPRDNGYKVYLGDDDEGSQIVSPSDAEISRHIERVAESSITDLPRSDDYTVADGEIVDEYVRLTAALASGSPFRATDRRAWQPRVVYTAMHGVGWEVARRVFAAAGFAQPEPVTAQIEPDAAFPTVEFPNPEEPGAMDLSYETADRVGADLILANDPDADRLAVAIPRSSTDTAGAGSWRRLTGNEVGALLGWRAAERERAAGTRGTLAASVVSSPALQAVARAYDLPYAETLTGFKWVSRVEGLAYGYEEALGYLVDPAKVRDKDGISAAVDFMALASELAEAGSSVAGRLTAFDERFGAFSSAQVSLRVTDLARISAITGALRQAPPHEIGGHQVVGIDDFAAGVGGFAPTDILRFHLAGDHTHEGSRVIIRPSGTEPKLKVYIDAWSTVGDASSRRSTADAVVTTLEAGARALLG
jgi:phosphomannomutase